MLDKSRRDRRRKNAMSKTKFTVASDKKTLIVERTFNAPRSKVWEAYVNPELLAKWWGPRGWKTDIVHMDFSDGGYWHYGMTCMDPAQGDWYGKTSWGKATFMNIKAQDSFEYADTFCDENGVAIPGMPMSRTILMLTDVGGGVTVKMKTEFETVEALAQVLEMGMEQGFTETWDRLGELLSN